MPKGPQPSGVSLTGDTQRTRHRIRKVIKRKVRKPSHARGASAGRSRAAGKSRGKSKGKSKGPPPASSAGMSSLGGHIESKTGDAEQAKEAVTYLMSRRTPSITEFGRRLHSTIDPDAHRDSSPMSSMTQLGSLSEVPAYVSMPTGRMSPENEISSLPIISGSSTACDGVDESPPVSSMVASLGTPESPSVVLVMAAEQRDKANTSFIHMTSLFLRLKKLVYAILLHHKAAHIDTHGLVFVAVFEKTQAAVLSALELQARIKSYNEEQQSAEQLGFCVDIAFGLALGRLMVKSDETGRVLGKAKASAWQLAKLGLEQSGGILVATELVREWDTTKSPISVLKLTEPQENLAGESYCSVFGTKGKIRISERAPLSLSDYMREYKEAPEFFDLLLSRVEAAVSSPRELATIDAAIDAKYGAELVVIALGLRAPTFDSLSECITSMLQRRMLFTCIHELVTRRGGVVIDNTTFTFAQLEPALAAAVDLHEFFTFDAFRSAAHNVSSLFSPARMHYTGLGVACGKVVHVKSSTKATVFFQGDPVRACRILCHENEASISYPVQAPSTPHPGVIAVTHPVVAGVSKLAATAPNSIASAYEFSDAPQESELGEAAYIMYMDHFKHVSLDRERVRWYDGQSLGVLVTDLSGFTRMTKKHGIIHFISLIHRVRQLLTPLFDDLDALFVETEADNFIVLFDDPVKALIAGVHVPLILEAYNNDPSFVVDDDFQLKLGGVGLGYGGGVAFDTVSEKFFGSPFDRAWDLGEDISSSGGVLLDAEMYAAVKDSVLGESLAFAREPPHPEYGYDGGVHYSVSAPLALLNLSKYLPKEAKVTSLADAAIEASWSASDAESSRSGPSPAKAVAGALLAPTPAPRHGPSLRNAVAALPTSFSAMVESRVNVNTSAAFMDELIERKYMTHKTAVMVGWDYASLSGSYGVTQAIRICQTTLRALKHMVDKAGGRCVNSIVWLFDSNLEALEAVWRIRASIQAVNAEREPADHIPLTGFGVHCGTILRVDETGEFWGDPLNVASKLGEDVASNSDVYITAEVYADAATAGMDTDFAFDAKQVVISKTRLAYYHMRPRDHRLPTALPSFSPEINVCPPSSGMSENSLTLPSPADRHSAATTIQRVYRGYAVRETMVRRERAARSIQRFMRACTRAKDNVAARHAVEAEAGGESGSEDWEWIWDWDWVWKRIRDWVVVVVVLFLLVVVLLAVFCILRRALAK
ncbi:uncharacterized protein AMSG_04486 [Thecamonas trahens ATCC 50062]|uniref:Guanylate cyclase domain-containing protein n=1 Tax=Thecamonas trahens ATCC 50062 TaxID=461836 RepID=A0A0L0D7C4_THETB|nr:hypothetical protein AMSG_04486 [Thecamonas trahens ATCC 50062]KNC48254.1 hypothetical protein AMSG_04486 [Thecamonas trahens ATCC 50062]|eukprot:XP_013758823.1 hypothetical protein AMSG_04486 [Thecamonas trahens ATCC 50062]